MPLSSVPRGARLRMRGRALPILQTAVAAVAAWSLAGLLVADPRPAFASIAAVISVGAVYGQRGERAVQLAGGVILGITAAGLLINLIGVGPLQLGLLVVLAMTAAVLIGGKELLVVEAGVSAILLVALDPAAGEGFPTTRILEAFIGGGAALAVSTLLFPPDPALGAGRAGQAVFAALGRTLESVATGLAERDPVVAEAALAQARAIDPLVVRVHASLDASRDAAVLAPARGESRTQLERYGRSLAQIDFAVRSTRVLARHALRLVRAGDVPPALPGVIADLGDAIWELAAAYDDPRRASVARELALDAAGRATALHASAAGLTLTELIGGVRSTAVDLVRAADLVAGDEAPGAEQPTEELLALPGTAAAAA